jgi:hypothetical protein
MIRAALAGDDPFAELSAALAELPPDQSRWGTMLAPSWAPDAGDLPNSTAWTCLAHAVWAVCTSETFEDAVLAAIDLGGDTDTVAAVTGWLARSTASRRSPAAGRRTSMVTWRRSTGARPTGALTSSGSRWHSSAFRPAPNDETEPPLGPVEIIPGVRRERLRLRPRSGGLGRRLAVPHGPALTLPRAVERQLHRVPAHRVPAHRVVRTGRHTRGLTASTRPTDQAGCTSGSEIVRTTSSSS